MGAINDTLSAQGLALTPYNLYVVIMDGLLSDGDRGISLQGSQSCTPGMDACCPASGVRPTTAGVSAVPGQAPYRGRLHVED